MNERRRDNGIRANRSCIILLFFIMVLTPSATAADTMFRANPEHTGVFDNGGIVPTNNELWRFMTRGTVSSSPAIANGVVYVGSYDKNLYVIDAVTGKEKWRFATGSAVFSSPAVSNEVVYVGSDDNNLYAIDAVTGTEKWQFATGDWVRSSPAVANGVVYIGSSDKNLYAIDAVTGAEKWRFSTLSNVYSSPAVSNGVVYVGSSDKNLYAIDAVTGAEKWRFSTLSNVYSSPAVSNGVVYVGSSDKNLYAIDAVTGAEKWRFSTLSNVYSSPAVSNGVVYVGSYDNNTYAIDAVMGTEKWRFKTGHVVDSSPAVSNGVVYVGSWDNNLYAIDAVTGTEKWRFETGGVMSSSPAVSNGVIYFGSNDKNLYAIDAVTGAEKWRFPTGRGASSSPAVSNGVVYFGSYDGNLYAVGGASTSQITTPTRVPTTPITAASATLSSGNQPSVQDTSVTAVFTPDSSRSSVSLPYKQHLVLQYNSATFQLNPENPPLYIEFKVYPENITDIKYVFTGTSDTTGKRIVVNRVDEFSQFTISIKNKNSGEILLDEGFGNRYDISLTSKQFVIREKGPYIVTLYGQRIEVDLYIHSSSGSETASPTISSTPVKIPTVSSSGSGNQITGTIFTNPALRDTIVGIVFSIVVIFIIYIISKKVLAAPHNGDILSTGSIPLPGQVLTAGSEDPLSGSAIQEHQGSIPWLVDKLKTTCSPDRNQIEEILVNKGSACVYLLINALPPDGELPELRELIFRILARIGNRQAEGVFLQGLVDRDQTIRFWAHYGMRESAGGYICP